MQHNTRFSKPVLSLSAQCSPPGAAGWEFPVVLAVLVALLLVLRCLLPRPGYDGDIWEGVDDDDVGGGPTVGGHE